MRRIALIALASASALLLGAAAAQADSLVFIRAGNVWLSTADGTSQFHVTLDATPNSQYCERASSHSPSALGGRAR